MLPWKLISTHQKHENLKAAELELVVRTATVIIPNQKEGGNDDDHGFLNMSSVLNDFKVPRKRPHMKGQHGQASSSS